MYYTRLPKTMLLTLVLTFIFLTLSASTSSCETDVYQTGNSYQTMAYNDAIDAGIPPQYFVNQINQESSFNPYAYSSEGAIGIAQFMPETAKGLGIDPWEPVQSLRGAAQLMNRYIAKYGSYRAALAAYNCGSECLEKAIRNCLDYYWCLSEQTQDYINKIME